MLLLAVELEAAVAEVEDTAGAARAEVLDERTGHGLARVFLEHEAVGASGDQLRDGAEPRDPLAGEIHHRGEALAHRQVVRADDVRGQVVDGHERRGRACGHRVRRIPLRG